MQIQNRSIRTVIRLPSRKFSGHGLPDRLLASLPSRQPPNEIKQKRFWRREIIKDTKLMR